MARTAVVLINLGTPEEPTTSAVRRYLREFLSDRRVVGMHPALWRPILELGVLAVRPRVSAAKYRTVWLDQGSPLTVYTDAQAAALREALGPNVEVAVAMRYGQPAIADVIRDLVDRGTERILVVPLYPQYAGSSTGTVLERVHNVVGALPQHPEVRTIMNWADDEGYVDAICTALEQRWEEVGRPDGERGDKVLLSYHGIPVSHAEAGDPYPEHCERTTAAIRERLDLDEGTLIATYQSKFGPAPWLTPATIDTVAELGAEGCERLEVVCPGFVSDCLETLEEICMLNKEAYEEAGGSGFSYVPWGNDRAEWTGALSKIVAGHLWPDVTPSQP